MKKNVLLTGATSGIGEAAAIEFAQQGCNLFLVARSREKAKKTEAKIRQINSGARIEWLYGDLASLDEVRGIADAFIAHNEALDILFNNAGLIAQKKEQTIDGFESMFAVNHLAAFLLIKLLQPKLLEGSGEARIVLTASAAYEFVSALDLQNLQSEKGFGMMRSYGHSKLCNILFTRSLSDKLNFDNSDFAPASEGEQARAITVNCFHPGFVGTGLGADSFTGKIVMGMFRPFIRSGKKGADTGVFLALDPSVKGCSGDYYYNRKVKKLKAHATDSEAAEALWQKSLLLAGLN